MLMSLSIIMLCGLFFGWVCKKMCFPSLFGMIIAGVIIGPNILNLIDHSILDISSDIRRIALIVILIRAGLKLNIKDLKKMGRPAVLMCFVPACFEILGMIMLAPHLLGLSILDSAIMGAVIGAVSPAVIVPRMIKLIDEGYGIDKGIPQMILAGASVDDVFVIVMFTTFTGLTQGGKLSIMSFVNVPISVVTGLLIGMLLGTVLLKWFEIKSMQNVTKIIIILGIAFALSTFETTFTSIPFASLIAIMCIGMAIKKGNDKLANKLSEFYDKIWVISEIFLFVLLGASIAVKSALSAGVTVVILLAGVMLFRMVGVFLCTIATKLTLKERLFCMIAYTPKATVQAAIGGLPLAMGLPCGQIILTVSVISILLTAPLGAFGIDLTYKKLLSRGVK